MTPPETKDDWTARHPGVDGLIAGAQASMAGLGIVAAPIVLSWLTAGEPRASFGAAARTSAAVWLAAHHTTITTPSGQITLVPLGLTMLLAAVCWWFARRASAMRPRGSRADLAAAQLAFIATYTVGAVVVALGSASVAARPHVETALLGAVVLSGLASAQPWWVPGTRRSGRQAPPDRERPGTPPDRDSGADRGSGARLARAVVAVLAFVSAVSTLLVVASLAIHYSRVQALYSALDPGPVGAIGLALVHLAAFPLLVVWGMAWLAGPGFSVGAGTSVTSAGATLGPLPALPLLGAVPSPGAHPVWVMPLAAGVFVFAGALAGGVLAAGRAHETRTQLARDLVAASALAGAVVGLLSWWASGSLGAGAMSAWGPAPVHVAAAVAAETLLGAAATAWVWPAVRRRRAGTADQA